MDTFEFDATLSAEDNLARFFMHLATIDPALANLLQANFAKMLPFADSSQDRAVQRSAFNRAIIAALDHVDSHLNEEHS
jgi:hypothetical protein